MSQLFSHEVAKVLEFQLQHHSLQRNPRANLLQNGLVGSPCSPRDSQESSLTPQFKSINFRPSAFFTVQLSHPYMTIGKTIAEFQRIARRDEKAFLRDQCKEIEQNNRMGKTRDCFKKIRNTKGTFHAKMGSIKDRNGMDPHCNE